MNHKSYDKGEVVFREGSFGTTMYEIVSGKVGIFTSYGLPEEQQLATMGAGETFGEMGVIEGYPRSATVVALEDKTAANEIGSDEFMDYLREQPDKVLSIMRQLSARLRATDERYVEACRTVYEAIEAEDANIRRSSNLRSRLTGLIHDLTGFPVRYKGILL
ncbi:MAG: cyclic nucleotide-binding domain-containing protein [Atopobiaceae bacterium]|nr:cyclic nucleotide-binding domain-containing protein [Atopobiaceae bacterium]MDO4403989.1 cyclic nucleotide-binding domain-containing protein [Atopobiaceae bacterium]